MVPHLSAGLHLIADFEGASRLDDCAWIEAALREGAEAAHATVLEVRLHPFGPGQGITGVALLAESHISIHTWPEAGTAAIDVFVCGATADPQAALAVIQQRLGGRIASTQTIRRLRAHEGIVAD
jgi:S-adenosylmethionine decarboxylase